MGGFTLFDVGAFGQSNAARQVTEPTPGATHRNDPATSVAAASGGHRLRGLRLAVLEVLDDAGEHGLTGHEACALTRCAYPHSATTRLEELAKVHLAEQTTATRETPSGKQAMVWRITEKGREVAAELRSSCR